MEGTESKRTGKLKGVIQVGEQITPEKVSQSTINANVNVSAVLSSPSSMDKPVTCVAREVGTTIARESNEGKPNANTEEGWIEELSRIGGIRLPQGHPCLEYLKGHGFDFDRTEDIRKFASNPSIMDGKRWYISVSVNGRMGEFLIDTGASHSAMSKRFFDLVSGMDEDLTTRVNACTADGSRIRTFGRTCMIIIVGGREYVISPTVAAIEDDGIIGMDFASLYGIRLNPVTGELKISSPYKDRVKCIAREVSGVASVVQTVKIPPGTACDVLISSSRMCRGEPGVFEPDVPWMERNGLESADTLIGNVAWGVAPITNPSSKTIYIKKGTVVGKVILAEAVTSSILKVCSLKTNKEELEEGVQKLLEEAGLEKDSHKTALKELLMECGSAFARPGEPLGRTNKVLHSINTGTAEPVKIPYRRLPLAKKVVAEEEITKMLKEGVIVPSTSPWSSPVCMVTKKDGSIRFCIDYRKLNGLTKKNSYPLPRIDETIDSLGGNEWFCTIDLQSGYWQVGMSEGDKEKTAFSSHIGLYQYNVMPFGLCNAPATFEAMMETLLSDLLWKKCLVYLDDVIIFGKTFDECLGNLKLVLGRIMSNGLKLKPKKCSLFQKSINYLGRIISTEGVKADPDKIKTVMEWSTPKCPKDVRSFLGFCSYYRDFLPSYSRLSYPIQCLSHWTPGRRKEPFPWGPDQERAFGLVKLLFQETPVLRYPTADGHFILDTDASNESIGAALSQVQGGVEVPIAFASNTMSRAQRNYCTTKREMLAVVVYTKKYRHFLWGSDFTLRTDHSSLRWLLNFKDAEGMIGRWLAHLSEFGLDHSQIEHRKGTKHVNADALSRVPVKKCQNLECDDCGKHNAVIAGIRKPFRTVEPGVLEWGQESIRDFQEKDPMCKRLKQLLIGGRVPERPNVSLENREMRQLIAQWTELEVVEDTIFRWKTNALGNRIRQILIPIAMRRDIMFFCHGHRTSGHFGKKRSLERLARMYYWPGMSTDLLRWIETCPKCCTSKAGPGMGRMPLTQELFGVRFARVAVDIITGFVTTPEGNTCMMVVTDYYTKYTKVFPLKDHKAATCARALVKGWILYLGVPLMLHSDQGREFESNLWTEMCHQLAICKTRTNPYRPQSDGQVERFNRTLIQVLKSLVNQRMDDWDEQCDFVCHAYNGTVHASTNCSPNLLVYGEDLIMPADLVFGVVGRNPEVPCQILFVEALKEQFRNAYELVRVELEKNAKWQKVGYDTNLKERRYRVGDLVARYHEPLVGIKLCDNWDGPWRITQRISDSTVLMRDTYGRNQKSNVARLKPWKGREYSQEMFEMGKEEREHVKRELSKIPVKRGRGRPRKVEREKVQKKTDAKTSVSVKEKVSAGVGKKGGKAIPKAKGVPEKAALTTRCEGKTGMLRRSPRLQSQGLRIT